MEIWKDIEGFEGHYQISNMGRLKSFKSLRSGRILSLKNSTGWYFNVVLYKENKSSSKSIKIHRLVAEHFIPNSDTSKNHINHKNGDKQDNRVDNLEWVTQRENVIHSIKRNPKQLNGMLLRNCVQRPKVIVQKTLEGKEIMEFQNSAVASVVTGVCRRNILQVASKTEYKPGLIRKQAGGYKWEFRHDKV